MKVIIDFFNFVCLGSFAQEEHCESFSRGQHRQAMKRSNRYHTAGIVDDIKVSFKLFLIVTVEIKALKLINQLLQTNIIKKINRYYRQ